MADNDKWHLFGPECCTNLKKYCVTSIQYDRFTAHALPHCSPFGVIDCPIARYRYLCVCGHWTSCSHHEEIATSWYGVECREVNPKLRGFRSAQRYQSLYAVIHSYLLRRQGGLLAVHYSLLAIDGQLLACYLLRECLPRGLRSSQSAITRI